MTRGGDTWHQVCGADGWHMHICGHLLKCDDAYIGPYVSSGACIHNMGAWAE